MNNYLRLLIGIPIAFMITVGLFMTMHFLIETADRTLDESKTRRIADITMPDVSIDVNVSVVKPDKPKEPDEPPPEMDAPEVENIEINPNAVNMTPQVSAQLSLKLGAGISVSDGEYLPMVKVLPIYPRRARSRGIEGYCTIGYTVTKAGATRDAFAVDCQPSGYFEKASIKAALKFKYKPRVIDGEPIDTQGVENRFRYEITGK